MDLVDHLARRLAELPGVRLLGHQDRRRKVAALSFTVVGFAAADLGGILDTSFNIAVRPGQHCAPYIHRRQGTFPTGTVRASPGPFSTREDVDRLADAVAEITRS